MGLMKEASRRATLSHRCRYQAPSIAFLSHSLLPLLVHVGSSDAVAVFEDPLLTPAMKLWNPPTPISNLIFSPCNFPIFPPLQHRLLHRHHQKSYAENDGNFICPGSKYAEFLCDLQKTLNFYAIQSLLHIYHKHLPVFRQHDGTPSIRILIVRQLIQPTSARFITKNSTEFGCLFKINCEPMTPETIQNFVRSTKAFTRIYTSALYSRLFPWKSEIGCRPNILALVVLDGVLTNPRKVTSVNLHSGNPTFATKMINIQTEATNMLLQGVPLSEVLKDMLDQLGYLLKEFQLTRGKFRRHNVPPWAWKLALSSIVLLFLSLITEWIVVRRASNKKMRGYELGKIKAVIKSKTHMIF